MLKNPFIKDTVTNQYQVLINQINALENNLKTLTDTELRNKTFQLKKTVSTRTRFRLINCSIFCNYTRSKFTNFRSSPF